MEQGRSAPETTAESALPLSRVPIAIFGTSRNTIDKGKLHLRIVNDFANHHIATCQTLSRRSPGSLGKVDQLHPRCDPIEGHRPGALMA
jgi:hypothetical protein